jgi:hypothetical protein
MAAVPAGLLQFHSLIPSRPVAMTVFLAGTVIAIWLGFGAAMPIDKAITLVYSN